MKIKGLILLFLFCFFLQLKAYAFDVSAECAYLMVDGSGECIYEKNSTTKHGMASTTKIMTAITALENANIDDDVEISYDASIQEGSSIYLRKGDVLKLNQLLLGMMLNSGNDAAYAVAEYVGGNIECFSELMNEKAKEIGLKNTNFKNPSGLDEEGHYSTAKDMAILTSYAMNNEAFRNIVSLKNGEINNNGSITYLKNHNKLLWNYDGCIGVKTGFTKATGRCLVSCAERNGVRLIAVTLDAPNDWEDHKKMLDYGFEKCCVKKIIKKGSVLKTIKKGNKRINAVCNDDVFIDCKKKSDFKPEIVVHTIKKPNYSIEKSEKIGYGELVVGNRIIKEFDLVSDNYIMIKNYKDTFYGAFKFVIKHLL